jgi:glucan phosphoethanolaminetransferase (alkaline phosphatase superfamily)
MVQRIQSVYLFITALLSALLLSGTILSFEDPANNSYAIRVAALQKIGPAGGIEVIGSILAPAIILCLIIIASVVTIFMFRNRKLQMKSSLALISLSVLLIIVIIWYMYDISTKFNAKINFRINLILPLLILISSVLAFMGIRKDEKLVRSYERLR